MKKKLTRKEKLELILRAVDLPSLVIEITHDGKKYKPAQYTELKKIIQEELNILSIVVNI